MVGEKSEKSPITTVEVISCRVQQFCLSEGVREGLRDSVTSGLIGLRPGSEPKIFSQIANIFLTPSLS